MFHFHGVPYLSCSVTLEKKGIGTLFGAWTTFSGATKKQKKILVPLNNWENAQHRTHYEIWRWNGETQQMRMKDALGCVWSLSCQASQNIYLVSLVGFTTGVYHYWFFFFFFFPGWSKWKILGVTSPSEPRDPDLFGKPPKISKPWRNGDRFLERTFA